MDIKVNGITRKGDMMFRLLKNIIVEENKTLLRLVADTYGLNYDSLKEKYLRPEYYLPLVVKDHGGV